MDYKYSILLTDMKKIRSLFNKYSIYVKVNLKFKSLTDTNPGAVKSCFMIPPSDRKLVQIRWYMKRTFGNILFAIFVII